MHRVKTVAFAVSLLLALALLRGQAWSAPAYASMSRTGVRSPVTDREVEAYARDGVVLLRRAFSPEWVAYMREAFDDAMRRPGPQAEFYMSDGDFSRNPFDQGSSQSKIDWYMDNIFFQEAAERAPAWNTIALRSPAAAIIATLMCSATAAFFYGQLIEKRGGASNALPWHHDLTHWKIAGEQVGTVWVALDHMPAAAGVRYVRGSHRWALPHPDAPPKPLTRWLAEGKAEALAFDVAPGDAICFDARVVHGSPANPAGPDESHRRVALRFGGDDAVYFDRQGHTPIPTPSVDRSHGLRCGDRLACPAFPTVYPPTGP